MLVLQPCLCYVVCLSDRSFVPVTLVDVVPAAPGSMLELPLPSKEVEGYCQESCTINGYNLPLFNQGDTSMNTLQTDFIFGVVDLHIFMPLLEVLRVSKALKPMT